MSARQRGKNDPGQLWRVHFTAAEENYPDRTRSMPPSSQPPTGADVLDALHNDATWTLGPALASAIACNQKEATIPVRELACVISLINDALNHGYLHIESAFMREPIERDTP